MPAYNATPAGNNPTGLLQPGVIAYAFGSRNVNLPTVYASITGLSANGSIGTLNVVIREGNIPLVGDLITVTGTSSSAGAFNVNNAVITAVSINAQTGVGTISYALAVTLSQTSDSGNVYVKVSAVPESISNNEASKAFALSDAAGPNDNMRTISMQVVYPAANAPSTATMTLQGSLFDTDAEYNDLISTTTLTTDLQQINLQNVRFVRAKVTNLTGASPQAIVRISV
jgi:hypothetical protein